MIMSSMTKTVKKKKTTAYYRYIQYMHVQYMSIHLTMYSDWLVCRCVTAAVTLWEYVKQPFFGLNWPSVDVSSTAQVCTACRSLSDILWCSSSQDMNSSPGQGMSEISSRFWNSQSSDLTSLDIQSEKMSKHTILGQIQNLYRGES